MPFDTISSIFVELNHRKTKSMKTYWVIEGSLNGQIIYWTGNYPHLSMLQSEENLPMWTPNIHEAVKMKSKEEAEKYKIEFYIQGSVEEHMDIEP